MTIHIDIEYVTRIEEENKELEKDKKAIHSIWKKTMNRENNLIEENKRLKQELFNLYLKHYN